MKFETALEKSLEELKKEEKKILKEKSLNKALSKAKRQTLKAVSYAIATKKVEELLRELEAGDGFGKETSIIKIPDSRGIPTFEIFFRKKDKNHKELSNLDKGKTDRFFIRTLPNPKFVAEICEKSDVNDQYKMLDIQAFKSYEDAFESCQYLLESAKK